MRKQQNVKFLTNVISKWWVMDRIMWYVACIVRTTKQISRKNYFQRQGRLFAMLRCGMPRMHNVGGPRERERVSIDAECTQSAQVYSLASWNINYRSYFGITSANLMTNIREYSATESKFSIIFSKFEKRKSSRYSSPQSSEKILHLYKFRSLE